MTPTRYISSSLEKLLVQGEGVRAHVYTDTRGNATVGVGRNIGPSGPGLSPDEIHVLLQNDIATTHDKLVSYRWFTAQNFVRQDALIELAFNMGVAGLLKFTHMLGALEAQNYELAARCLEQSAWAQQVQPSRVASVATRLRTGVLTNDGAGSSNTGARLGKG